MSEKQILQEGWTVPIDRVEAFTSGAAMAVEVHEIEKQLRSFWRQAAERAQKAGSQLAVIRACLWNFVVQVRGEAELFAIKPLLDEVTHAVPARILLLYETDESGGEAGGESEAEPIVAYVEANVRKSGGKREVLAEEITLQSRRLAARRLPSLVRSLLLSDLPTAVFLSGKSADLCQMAPLVKEADRLVIDTGALSGQKAFFALASQVLSLPGSSEVMDLGWLRLLPFRQEVAALFDGAEERAFLQSIDALEIHYSKGSSASALLLCGWLMSQLSLTLAGRARSAQVGQVMLKDEAGLLMEARLLCDRTAMTVGGQAGIGRVVLRAGSRSFVVDGADGRRRARPDSQLLMTALGVYGRDPLLLAALRAALTLVGQIPDDSP